MSFIQACCNERRYIERQVQSCLEIGGEEADSCMTATLAWRTAFDAAAQRDPSPVAMMGQVSPNHLPPAPQAEFLERRGAASSSSTPSAQTHASSVSYFGITASHFRFTVRKRERSAMLPFLPAGKSQAAANASLFRSDLAASPTPPELTNEPAKQTRRRGPITVFGHGGLRGERRHRNSQK